jgi:hypothetical protein
MRVLGCYRNGGGFAKRFRSKSGHARDQKARKHEFNFD